MIYRYYGCGTHMSADLKMIAHRIRTKFDQMPKVMKDAKGQSYNPRKRRLISLPVGKADWVIVAPGIDPKDRHKFCNTRPETYSDLPMRRT